jgi:hypothetical protein
VIPLNIECHLEVGTNNGVGGTNFTEYPMGVCPTVTIPGTYTVRIRVCNTGQYALTNVTATIVASTGNCLASPILFSGNLMPGACATNNLCQNTCTALSSNYYKVNVRGEASQAFGHICTYTAQGTNIVATNMCATCVICTGCPQINILKGVACVVCSNDGSGVVLFCASARGIFEHDAFGVRSDTQDPAFCYELVVTNTGTVAATDVRLDDEILGITNLSLGTLGVNGSFVTNILHSWHDTTTNFASASAQSLPGCPGVDANSRINVSTNAIAHVRPASIRCDKLVSVNGSTPASTYTAVCASNIVATNITWYVVVHNTGQADLSNVTISEDLTMGDALPCTNVTITLPGILAAGTSTTNIPVCTSGFNTCVTTNVNNFIVVSALAAAEGTNCVWTIQGSNITTRSECNATLHLCCFTSVPTACRTTGGGRTDLVEDGQTVLCPPNVRYVTYGGQVGAPVGDKICVVTPQFFLGNPCIHGRWTHVRHEQGGLEGNFHGRFYDTLDCACLETNYDGTGLYAPGTVVNGVCGNRNIGPLPRKAPANKIVFTGVGDWADPNGRRAPRSVLFRVDLEDRGEPGNDHTLDLGHKSGRVPDRYRIRIWVLSDTELLELSGGGADPYLLNFRNAISACHGIEYFDGVTTPYVGHNCAKSGSIVFGGPGDPEYSTLGPAAAVRLPDIDDGGEQLHGNHQIHPSIMPCDPNNPVGPGLPH